MSSPDPLVTALAAALTTRQTAWRKAKAGTFGVLLTPAVPADLIVAFAEVLVPVVRAAAAEAVAQQAATRRAEHLDGLVRESAEMGLYESTATPKDAR